jgi:GlcNAc-P-P-Und epimerase
MATVINVIGGSGFVGARLCRRLQVAGVGNFVIIDKAPSLSFADKVAIADVRSVDALRRTIADNAVIVNLAAEHRDDVRPRSLYDDVNIGGARNICTVAREKNVKTIVFTSSVAVYGFAPIGTSESGRIAPFNDYGRTKFEAEEVCKTWQAEAPGVRTLVIVRPTVIFGEQNRGNVYNLLRQIASGRFVMVGDGKNRKSMTYVENVAAFLEYAISFKPGVHIYNLIDKPDFTMNELVGTVNRILGKSEKVGLRLPFTIGYLIGKGFDAVAAITGKRFPVSGIRVKKFCTDSVYQTAVGQTEFVPPVPLADALEKTVRYEFLESHEKEGVYYTE